MKFLSLDHVGIAVEDAEKAAALFETLTGNLPYAQEDVAGHGVRTHFISAGTAKIELLEGLGRDSPITRYLERHGEGIHHIAFEVDDVHAAFDRLKAGFRPLSDAPKPGADDKLVFFLHPKDTGGVLIEFCQSVEPSPKVELVGAPQGDIAAFAEGNPQQPALFVLHGIGGSTGMETAQLARRMAERYFVVALDFSGHGASSDPEGAELSFDLFTENVLAVLDHFDLARAHVFGFSMGGAVALKAAREYPERFERAAAHATYVYWDDPRAAMMAKRLDPDALIRENPAAAERMAKAHGAERWQDRFRAMQAFARALPGLAPSTDDLSEISSPVLVSACDRDPFFEIESSLRLQRELPDARFVTLPGERHSLHAADVEVLSRLLHNFLGG